MRPTIPPALRLPALVALALALRLVWPLADPARRLSWSSGLYTDPANVTHAARNAVLFGEWIRDASRDLVFYPLFNVLTWVAYLGLGVGRLSTQILAAVLGAVTVAAIAWATSRAAGRRAATLAALFVAMGYWLVAFGRVPLVENLVGALLATASALALGRRGGERFAAGLVAGVAVLFGKFHAIAFVPALLVFVAMRERRVAALAPPALGLAVALAAWIPVIFLPYREAVLDQVRGASGVHGAIPLLRSPLEGLLEPLRAIQRSWIFVRAPVLGLAGVVFTLVTLVDRERRSERIERGSAIFPLWFLAAWIYHALLPYQAPRYYLPAAVALVAAAACQLEELGRAGALELRRPRSAGGLAAWVVGLVGAGVAVVVGVAHGAWVATDLLATADSPALHALRRFLVELAWNLNPFPVVLVVGLGVAAASALALGGVATRPARSGRPRRHRRFSGPRLARLAVVAALLVNGGQIVAAATHRTYAIEEAKASLDRVVGGDAVLLGAMAPALVQDSRRTAIPRFGETVSTIPPALGVTHIVTLGDPASSPEFGPGILESTVEVRRWPLRTHFLSTVGVFRVPNDDYRPTLFERAVESLARERPREALDLLAELRASGGSEFHDLLATEARCFFRLGDLDRATRALLRAIEIRPTHPADYFNLGTLASRAGDRRAALELWRRGLSLDPDDPDLTRAVEAARPAR